MEIKKLKKLVLSLQHELERLQRSGSNRNRERELEEKLEERERELRELRRRKSGFDDDDAAALREAEARNADLEDELENARGLLEENMDEIERLRELVERRGDLSANESIVPEVRRDRLKRRVEKRRAIRAGRAAPEGGRVDQEERKPCAGSGRTGDLETLGS